MGRALKRPQDSLSAGNTEKIVVYVSGPSPCARRVLITLIEKGLDFDTVEVDLANMQQRSPDYIALNPNGFVPTLVHKGNVLFESSVINEYLEDQFSEVPLLPSDPYQRAQARMWTGAELAMAKVFRAIMYQRLMGPVHHVSRTLEEARAIARKASDDPQDLMWETRVWRMEVLTPEEEQREEAKLFDWLDNVEQALKGKTYLVGDAFSQADISLYPRIAMFDYLGATLEARRYPNVLRWMAELEKRDSFEASMTAEARKLRSAAVSPLLHSLFADLKVPQQERSLIDRSKLWLAGTVLRRVFGVEALLRNTAPVRPLWLPKEQQDSVCFRQLTLSDENLRQMRGELVLYGFPLSPGTQRVMLLLQALKISHRLVPVETSSVDAFPQELLQCNPQRELPVLVQEGRVICNADVIAEYACAQTGSDDVWQPGTSAEAAKLRMWLALEAGSHKEFQPLWQRYVDKSASVTFIADEQRALSRIQFPLGILDCALQSTLFLCGSRPSYADFAWFTRIQALQAVPQFSLAVWPHLERWYRAIRPGLPLAAGHET